MDRESTLRVHLILLPRERENKLGIRLAVGTAMQSNGASYASMTPRNRPHYVLPASDQNNGTLTWYTHFTNDAGTARAALPQLGYQIV